MTNPEEETQTTIMETAYKRILHAHESGCSPFLIISCLMDDIGKANVVTAADVAENLINQDVRGLLKSYTNNHLRVQCLTTVTNVYAKLMSQTPDDPGAAIQKLAVELMNVIARTDAMKAQILGGKFR